MTSNIGADNFKGSREVGFFGSDDESAAKRLSGYFKPEFINRIDDIILFSALDLNALKNIAKSKIIMLKERISDLGISLEFSEEVLEYIAQKGKKSGMGARPIGRLITGEIENRMAKMIIDGLLKSGDTLRFYLLDGKITCTKAVLALSSANE